MRAFVLSLFVCVAVLFPNVGNAQVYGLRTAAPEVTASAADWQLNSEPIIVNSSVYLPTREVRFFDGQVMVQVGVYERVPVYADATLEPHSILYVPIGRDRLRTYERRRDRELAGTTGSRTPSFPVESPSAPPVEERIVGTSGTLVPSAVGSSTVATPRPRPSAVETVPRPRSNTGVWLDFGGARWYSAGASASYSPDRFTKAGEYRGYPVFRENGAKKNEIWVQAVEGGPLAPYARR